MTPLLFVVSRKEPERYHYLQRVFAQEVAVEVVLDRREGERRRKPGAPQTERRRRERRQREVIHELMRLGYALVRR
jgi:hypothetical protein